MNAEYEKQLEAQIDRVLKLLPLLSAPNGLSQRVMQSIGQQASLPWHSRPWQSWPLPLRVISLVILLGSFGGLCFTAWHLTRAAGFSAAMQEVGQLFAGVSVIWNALNTLAVAGFAVLKHMGTTFIIGLVGAAVMGYAVCLGLGTVYLRLALARN